MMTVEAVLFLLKSFLQSEWPLVCLRREEKPDVTYNDVGGAKEQLERLREAPTPISIIPRHFVADSRSQRKGRLGK